MTGPYMERGELRRGGWDSLSAALGWTKKEGKFLVQMLSVHLCSNWTLPPNSCPLQISHLFLKQPHLSLANPQLTLSLHPLKSFTAGKYFYPLYFSKGPTHLTLTDTWLFFEKLLPLHLWSWRLFREFTPASTSHYFEAVGPSGIERSYALILFEAWGTALASSSIILATSVFQPLSSHSFDCFRRSLTSLYTHSWNMLGPGSSYLPTYCSTPQQSLNLLSFKSLPLLFTL